VVLVPDSYANPDIGAGLDRMVGIFTGMILLEPVRWLPRLITKVLNVAQRKEGR
jgi:hypothetical protein